MVGVWDHHHGGSGGSALQSSAVLKPAASRCVCVSGVVVSLRGHLRDGHVPERQPRHLHVQHAVRLQVRADAVTEITSFYFRK